MFTITHAVLLLLVVGIILLIVEVFIPGFGVFGGLGVASIIAASIILAVTGHLYLALAQVALVGLGIVTFVKFASKRGMFSKLVMSESLAEDKDGIVDLSNYAGRSGVALTSMRPVGTVDFGGVPIEAYSAGAFVGAGEKVVVTGYQDNKLYVKPVEKKSQRAN